MVKKRIDYIIIALSLMFIPCILIGCTNDQRLITPATSTSTTLSDTTKTVTATIKPSATLTGTATQEPLSEEEITAWLTDKIYHPECELPCIWGITPGETSWQQAYEIIAPYASEIDPFDSYDDDNEKYFNFYFFEFLPHEIKYNSFYVGFGYDQTEVFEVSINGLTDVPDYSIQSLLTQYGMPEEIWVYAYSAVPYEDEFPRPSMFYVYYPDYNFLALYTAAAGSIENGMIRNCIDYGPDIDVWSENHEADFLDFLQERLTTFFGPFLTLEEAVGMSVDEFYEAYKDEAGEVCVLTPVDLWRFNPQTEEP